MDLTFPAGTDLIGNNCSALLQRLPRLLERCHWLALERWLLERLPARVLASGQHPCRLADPNLSPEFSQQGPDRKLRTELVLTCPLCRLSTSPSVIATASLEAQDTHAWKSNYLIHTGGCGKYQRFLVVTDGKSLLVGGSSSAQSLLPTEKYIRRKVERFSSLQCVPPNFYKQSSLRFWRGECSQKLQS